MSDCSKKAISCCCDTPDNQQAAPTHEHAVAGRWRLGSAGALAIGAEVLHFWELAAEPVIALVAIAAIALCGLETFRNGWRAVLRGDLNITALMSVAVTGAFLIGQWPEAAMVMVLFVLAELIEERSVDRARGAISDLLTEAPPRATVRQEDGSWVETDVDAIGKGAILRVRPGERIALDGVVTQGHSSVNQAPITGESLPVNKQPGDSLFAGTINHDGGLEFQVTATAGHTTLARIVRAVEQAQGAKAATQRFVDRFARVYTPGVFIFACVVALIPPLMLGGAWLDWIYRALVLLVVACPCALVISTPVTLVSGLAAAARRGILVKGGMFLELGARLDLVALDKTGTLTHGKPLLTDLYVLPGADEAGARLLATSLAARSDHPVSRAIALDPAAPVELVEVDGFVAAPGRGVRGRIAGNGYVLGNQRMLEEASLSSEQVDSLFADLQAQGKSAIGLAGPDGPVAVFGVADTLREQSRQAVERLRILGVRTVMLTGDHLQAANAIAGQAGVDDVLADLLPQGKLDAVSRLQAGGARVGMVGDGINDAPALAQADIGFAMAAAGTDTAIETADVALMDDDPGKLATFVILSRRTMAILKQNIALALVTKAVFLAVTLTGHATMWMAVFADMGVSLLVVMNGLRVLRLAKRDRSLA